MKIGDLVKVKKGSRELVITEIPATPGIIIDTLEMDDGFNEYEVMFEDWGIGWFSDLMLEGVGSNE